MTQTIEIWSDTRGHSICRGKHCGARLLWAEVVGTGRRMCFDGEPVALKTRHDPTSGRLIETLELSANHWSTCPDALEFKFRRGARGVG